MANLILSFLEILFPTSFDRVKKEKPVQKGLKPFLISQREILDNLLKKLNEEFQLRKIPTLGVSHIILVRNKASKEKAENEFSIKYKCPVFTIFESKVFINKYFYQCLINKSY